MAYPLFISKRMPGLIRLLRALLVVTMSFYGGVLPATAQQQTDTRLKELVSIQGIKSIKLTGYGLVTGLDRTGDRAYSRRSSPYTVQSIANMLRQFNIRVDPALVRSRNTAAVMVTATLGPFHQEGSEIDVTVSSLGDARSLSGGVLIQTPLREPGSNEVYAIGQGPVSTGAVSASGFGSRVQIDYTTTGRIPGGAIVQQALLTHLDNIQDLGLALKRPDFTNANRIVETINEESDGEATIQHAGLVMVTLPDAVDNVAGFIGQLHALTVPVDVPARVVINERTGTIVAGGNVQINEAMITSGNIIVSVQAEPLVSQPPPFSEGETAQATRGTVGIDEETTQSIVLPPNTDVNQLATSLNDLSVQAREIVSIFQAIDQAGALQGELIIQ